METIRFCCGKNVQTLSYSVIHRCTRTHKSSNPDQKNERNYVYIKQDVSSLATNFSNAVWHAANEQLISVAFIHKSQFKLKSNMFSLVKLSGSGEL